MTDAEEIRALDDTTVSRIAAGEVVERPASAVKELVENSLDAGADRVDVAVERGGKDLVRVKDDGAGMTEAAVRKAVRRHTTSKLRTAADLEAGVPTLGFRGEALHAIGAVSTLVVRTKPPGVDVGTELRVEGGEVVAVEPVGCPTGTIVEVTDLFADTPAREKYLRQDRTEFARVNEVVTNYALANPDVAVSLAHDGRDVFATPGGGDLGAAVMAVYGREVAQSMRPIEATPDGPLSAVRGLVSHPETTRSSRDYVSTFVNGRYVPSRTAREAVVAAYGDQLAPDRFPFAAVFIEADPERVDVNVHPRKLDVRFADEAAVRRQVFTAVREALLSHGLLRSGAPRGRSAPAETEVSPDGSAAGSVSDASARDTDASARDTDASARDTNASAGDASTPAGDASAPAGDPSAPAGDDDPPGDGRTGEGLGWLDRVVQDASADGEGDLPGRGPTDSGDVAEPVDRIEDRPGDGSADGVDRFGDRTSDGTRESIDRRRGEPAGGDGSAAPSGGAAGAPDGEPSGDVPWTRETNWRAGTSFVSGAGDLEPGRKFGGTEQRTLTGEAAAAPREFEQLPPLRVLGQYDDTYVVAAAPDGLVLVDQHAADERVNYERLRERVDGEPAGQALAEPVTLELTAGEAALFEEYRPALARLGFETSPVEGRRVEVRSVPAVISDALEPSLLRDVLSRAMSGAGGSAAPVESRADELLADLACHPSVTGHTSLSEGSVLDLLAALDACENPYACPHGRPVLVHIDDGELDDRFERDYPGHAGRRH